MDQAKVYFVLKGRPYEHIFLDGHLESVCIVIGYEARRVFSISISLFSRIPEISPYIRDHFPDHERTHPSRYSTSRKLYRTCT